MEVEREEDSAGLESDWDRYRARTIEQPPSLPEGSPQFPLATTSPQARSRHSTAPDTQSTPPLPSTTPSRMPTMFIDPRWSLQRKLEAALKHVDALEEENAALRHEKENAIAHADLAREHATTLQNRLNTKKNRAPKRTVKTKGARWITSSEGRVAFRQQEEEKQGKREKAEARRLRKEQKDKDLEERRQQMVLAGDAYRFEGPVNVHRLKPDLQNIASALFIPFDAKLTTKAVLVDLINAHMEKHQTTLQANERFAGLWSSGRGRSQKDSAVAAPSQTAAPPLDAAAPLPPFSHGEPSSRHVFSRPPSSAPSQPSVAGPSRQTVHHPHFYHPYNYYPYAPALPPPFYPNDPH